VKIIDCKQGESSWHFARAGIPTASEFDRLVTPEFKIRTGDTPKTYLHEKLAEKLMGQPLEFDVDTFAMDQGRLLESEALPWLDFAHGIKAERIGFCTTDDGLVGCSPDGLVGDNCGVEVKCPRPQKHLSYLLAGELPKEYAAQVYGSMYVTGSSSWYFLSYSRQFPKFLLKIERDEAIMSALDKALREFTNNMDAALAKIKALQ